MKLLLIILSVGAHLFCFSQLDTLTDYTLPDSIKIYLQNHSKVEEMIFEVRGANQGQIKYMGWSYISYYHNLDSSKKEDEKFFARVGKWYSFNKKQTLIEEVDFGFHDTTMIIQKIFRKDRAIKSINFYHGKNEKSRQLIYHDFKTRYNEYETHLFYKNGNVKSEIKWCKLKFCGDYKSYYKNGNLTYFYPFDSNGKKNGKFEYYYEDGKPRRMGQYLNNRKTGLWKSYKKNGELKKEKEFN